MFTIILNLAPGADYVKAVVLKNILNYSKSSQLNKFGGRFKYSKFQKLLMTVMKQ